MTSSNENIFHFNGQSTGHRWIPLKGQWREALMSSLICTRINGWVNSPNAGDLRRHCAHYDFTVMCCVLLPGAISVYTCRCRLTIIRLNIIGIPSIMKRRSHDRIFLIMEITIPRRLSLYWHVVNYTVAPRIAVLQLTKKHKILILGITMNLFVHRELWG